MNRGICKALLTVGIAVYLGGCVSYVSYPPVQGPNTATADCNNPAARECMAQAVSTVLDRWPAYDYGTAPAEPNIAVSLPPGMRRSTYQYTATRIGHGAAPYSAETSGLPLYLVGKVWIRGGQAWVDVVKPMRGQPGVYNGVTVELEGAMSSWRVVRSREWNVGTVPVPEPNPIQANEFPDPPIEPLPTPAQPEPAPPAPADASVPAPTEQPTESGEGSGET